MFAGNRTLAGKQVKNVYEKALELEAQHILITECGHAYRSLAFEGPYLAGYPDGKPPVHIVHYVQLLSEYLRDGRIKIDPHKKIQEPITYQDPCNVSRNGGLWEHARNQPGTQSLLRWWWRYNADGTGLQTLPDGFGKVKSATN
jgi:Fe-S oxidoreductase